MAAVGLTDSGACDRISNRYIAILKADFQVCDKVDETKSMAVCKAQVAQNRISNVWMTLSSGESGTALVTYVKGDVYYLPKDSTEWLPVTPDMMFKSGDQIKTGSGNSRIRFITGEDKDMTSQVIMNDTLIMVAKNSNDPNPDEMSKIDQLKEIYNLLTQPYGGI
jgi:hypothetical protein